MSDIFEAPDELDDEGLEILKRCVRVMGFEEGVEAFRLSGYGVWEDNGHFELEEWRTSVDQRVERLVARLGVN